VLLRSIEIEKGVPGYAAVNPNTNTIYISYTSSNFILVIDISKGSAGSKILANSPRNIAVNQVTNKVYVSSSDGIYEIDALTNKSEVIKFGIPYPHGAVDINQVSNTLYTTCFGSGDTITAIDLAKKVIMNKIVVNKKSRFSSDVKLHGVAVHSSENEIYVINPYEKFIPIFDFQQSDKPISTIQLEEDISPKFILVNEMSKLLYIHATGGVPAPAGASYETLLVFDIGAKKKIQGQLQARPPSHANEGFAFNRSSNTLYMKKKNEKSIIKYDAYAKQILNSVTLERRTSFWQRFYEGFYYFAHVTVINPSTNKVYVSDSKNSLLYEIDG
jgi:DNA-binding beta-propeller fold protein YncE